MKPEQALLRTTRLGHTRAFQDAVNFPANWIQDGPQLPVSSGGGGPPLLPPASAVSGNGLPGATYDWSFLNLIPSDVIDPSRYPGVFGPQQSSIDSTPPPAEDYPSPGDDNTHHNTPSLINRLINNIPAVRLARTVSGLFNRNISPGWQQNAASNQIQGVVPVPVGGAIFGYNPSSGGAGGTSSYNFGTGQYTATPSTNPLYNTGNGWMPVSGAPADVRWAQNSGTGNFTADQFTKSYELSQSGGTPNFTGTTTDAGHNIFYNNVGERRRMDSEGGFEKVKVPGSVSELLSQARAARERYQQAINANPVPAHSGFDLNYVQKLNDWLRMNQAGAAAPASNGLSPELISSLINRIAPPPQFPTG